MYNIEKVFPEKMQPFKLSEHRQRFKESYDFIESGLNKAGIKWVSFTKNVCYEDLCHVLTPKGYPINMDSNHLMDYIAEHWITVYDFITEFG